MATISATIRINDAFSGPLNKLKSGLESAQGGFNKLKNKLSGNGGTFGGATKGADGLFKSMLGANIASSMVSKGFDAIKTGATSMIGELNEASISWQTFDGNMKQLGKSPAQIQAAKSQMQKFAQQTIYSASDMSSTYAQLAAVGTKNTAQLVKGFGGLAASADDPKQAMKTLSEQATQMAAKPKVQWQDFKLMLEQAPGGIAAVAKSMGTSTRGLIKDVQAGTVSTDKFLAAIAKTGTNANFSKMATEYKTVGQAMDGLKETLANKLQPAFDSVGKVGIKAIESITDKLDGIDGKQLGQKITAGIQVAQNAINNFKESFANGMAGTLKLQSITNMFSAVRGAIRNVKSALSGMGGDLAHQLGSLAGKGLTGAANAITDIANAIKRLRPEQIQSIAKAITIVAGSALALKSVTGVFNGMTKSIAPLFGMLEKFAGFGVSATNGISEMFTGVGTAVSKINELKNAMQSLKEMRQVSNLAEGTGALSGLSNTLSGITTKIAGIGTALTSAFSPVTLIIVAIGAVIAGAVAAWTTNFMNFRSVVSGVFSNLGNIFAPFVNSIRMLGQALTPVMPLIRGLGQAFMLISVGTLMGIALAIGVVVDALTAIISIGAGVVNAVKAIAQGFHALGDAMSGNFSGATRDIEDAKNAIDDMKNSFGNVGNAIGNGATANLVKQFSLLGSTAKKTASEVNGTKISPQVDVSSANRQLASLSNKKIPAPKVETPKLNFTNPFQSLITTAKSTKLPAPTIETPKVQGGANISQSITKSMPKTLPGPTIQTPKVEGGTNIGQSITKSMPKNIPAPKVEAPKVPTPKMPGTLKQIPAPKVGTPHVPTPKMPHLGTIPAPKVGTPHIPTPTLPHLGTIPAPHVARPSMAGVVSAVSAGMARAAAAARAGGAALSSAVRGAVSQAVAAGRAGAGAMYGVGVQIGAGLANGIRSQIGAVAAAANALIAQAERASRAAAKVHSPSRVWFGIGDFIGQGLALGINSTAGEVAQASAGIINQASDITPTINAPNVGYNSSMGYGVGGIGPNTYGTTNNYQQSTNAPSRVVNINSGAITVNSTGDAKTDVDAILTELEQRILNAGDKSLY